MILQLAIPVTNNKIAPIPIAIIDVSPIEPGIKPITESIIDGMPLIPSFTASPNGVAPE